VRVLLIAAVVAAAAGCGRTALEPPYDPSTADAGRDRPTDLPAEKTDAPPDLPPDLPKDHPPDLRPETISCVPTDEECNGLDDDCDGIADNHIAPIPCANAGDVRLCVGGHFSECPKRCGICVPGSERTCITSFCTFWGSQTCDADGMSFGDCRESTPPAACKDVANKMMRSPELEMCCIKNNFCCVDEFDLNGNGDRTEMLGRCESVICE